jgi:hypothetical protein
MYTEYAHKPICAGIKIKVALRKMGWENAESIQLAHDKD